MPRLFAKARGATARPAQAVVFGRQPGADKRGGPECVIRDRLRIRTGHGPENTTRLGRFAIGVIRSHTDDRVAAAMRRLDRNPRRVFDYLRMTRNTLRTSSTNRRTN